MPNEVKDKLFYENFSLNLRGHIFDLSTPKVMGILNLTPDSFYSGSRVAETKDLLLKIEGMLEDGADILDIGAQSTRPGAELLTAEEEKSRFGEKIALITEKFPHAVISIDTFYSSVASFVLDQGAHIINDVSGGERDAKMFETVASYHDVPYILMHMRGDSKTMTGLNDYNDVVSDVLKELKEKVDNAHAIGIRDIIVDPGFGFAKSPKQSFKLLQTLQSFKIFELPVLAGLSRKSMIYKTIGKDAERALNGTTVLNTIALLKGAKILRVHDIREAVEAVTLYNAVEA